MFKKLAVFLVLAGSLLSASASWAASTTTAVTPDQALSMLMAGNREFVRGEIEHLERMSTPARRTDLVAGQHPYAIVLTCSDSRVPPEILFDKGLGEIFVARVAGNIASASELLGSIEYGVEHLGASLIMVLGHSKCGAVTATYDSHVTGTMPAKNIDSLVKAIDPAVTEVLATNPTGTKAEVVEECIVENIKKVAESIEVNSPIVKEYLEVGKVKLVKAKYDLATGVVTVLP
ncbi:carbonic anhydrase [Geomonas oryzisoli]|uniref:Carbonic anhydrase n=1 Tax=Geomonas oryzisoli TaxID=2847992 RepID=A0ABX8JA80_9BACT|nr:carbonic anhydrase [Geomonas oryzisoli]QWV94896.1 carbonic anhydrase [Geomonas oryzisoli]